MRQGDWLVKPPEAVSSRQAMALEKAGLTPDKGEVLVTGAVGGVGSVAVAILPGTASSPTCRWKSSKR